MSTPLEFSVPVTESPARAREFGRRNDNALQSLASLELTGSAALVAMPLEFCCPRHIRVLRALLQRSLTREEVDNIAGSSNGPQTISEIRKRGLKIPCEPEPVNDRDGKLTYRGRYALTPQDRGLLARATFHEGE